MYLLLNKLMAKRYTLILKLEKNLQKTTLQM